MEEISPTDSATQPVVQVLVGDCNLTLEIADEAVQPMQPPVMGKWNTVWTVHTTGAGQSGDVIFVKGAHAESFDLPFGYSHEDRGIRNDSGIELRVKVKSSIQPGASTNDDRQSARDEEDASQSSDASQLASGWVLVQ